MSYAHLLKKYDVPVPRYTSYPTVPHWDVENFDRTQWWSAVKRVFDESNAEKGISIYIHLPFCESLCTYCACNTRITRNHAVEERYLKAVLAEWNIYKARFGDKPIIRELHLGGGTPTFFSSSNLERLIKGIFDGAEIHENHEFSFEGHPNNTTIDHLQILANLGFDRVSFGVQDLDPRVQKAINRIQPFEVLQRAVNNARATGYKSISFDLVYGLPYQTLESVEDTVSRVLELKPDRLAFYSYAHVPWIKPGQRGYEDADLPTDLVKRSLYEEGRRQFLQVGYLDVGMDHFALPEDSLAIAMKNGSLHRNFMGYTTNPTELLVGLGCSSISDAKYAYAQNEKKVEAYEALVNNNEEAIFKGHIQTEEDLKLRSAIKDVTCRGRVSLYDVKDYLDQKAIEQLREMEGEGLLEKTSEELIVTEPGRAFIRNIAAVFDKRLHTASLHTARPLFSKAI